MNQTFALLDTVQRDNEDKTGELMNDSDVEFIDPQSIESEIELSDNPENVLTPEANVHVVDEETTHTKELKANKKRKTPEENTPIT